MHDAHTSTIHSATTGAPACTCPVCAYSLAGLPTRGTCPECGTDYDAISGTPLTRADKVARTPRCHHCYYNLTGLPSTGPCPECGRAYDTADGPPPSLAEKAAEFPERLSLGVAEAQPWFWEKFLLGPRAAAILIAAVGTAAFLIWAGWRIIQAVNFKLVQGRSRGDRASPPPTSADEFLADALTGIAHSLPIALIAFAAATAYAGLRHRRVCLSPSLTLSGEDAQSLGRFALYAALALGAVFAWCTLRG